ncbi:hypothetical protein [Flexivirga caeni]|uniref:Uncharacterized protein n=1 Tax=Flexivirga caeni TaxID=2294115 RepID=A0A3M9M5C7_9MICO|nr:hypothetical protein [Flexivirga caeni]RNI20706.1 hypothetical protein EFY87_14080 [Flexivirga caeni]
MDYVPDRSTGRSARIEFTESETLRPGLDRCYVWAVVVLGIVFAASLLLQLLLYLYIAQRWYSPAWLIGSLVGAVAVFLVTRARVRRETRSRTVIRSLTTGATAAQFGKISAGLTEDQIREMSGWPDAALSAFVLAPAPPGSLFTVRAALAAAQLHDAETTEMLLQEVLSSPTYLRGDGSQVMEGIAATIGLPGSAQTTARVTGFDAALQQLLPATPAG